MATKLPPVSCFSFLGLHNCLVSQKRLPKVAIFFCQTNTYNSFSEKLKYSALGSKTRY